MEAKTQAETLQGQIVSTDAEARSPANEPARAGPVDEIPNPIVAEKIDPESEKKDIQDQQAPTAVASLEAGLAAVEISPSSTPGSTSVPNTGRHSPSGFPRSDYVPPLPGTGMDATNVFIKYLPTDLTNTGLFTLFSQFGEITSCKVMVDPITGYSLGYGFVRFSTSEEAANAITNMYGTTIGSKTLLCKLSHGIPQNNATPSDNLYIKPLLDTTSEADLLALFSPHGRVLECKVMMDKNTGQSRQIGFVRFATIEEATKALAANNGRYLTEDAPPMVVKYAESRAQKIARRAKLLANQAAAESRRNQLKYQQAQQAELYAQADAGEGSLADGTASESHAPGTETPTPTSMPYMVKDEFGNVTFAPDLEQVEEAAAAIAAASAASGPSPANVGGVQDPSPHHGFWPTPAVAAAYQGPQHGAQQNGTHHHVASSHHHHHHGSHSHNNGENSRSRRGGAGGAYASRRGPGGNSRRPVFQAYQPSEDSTDSTASQDESTDATQMSTDSYTPTTHQGGRNSGGAVYRKKGSVPASGGGNSRHSQHGHQHHHHHNNHHQGGNHHHQNGQALPTMFVGGSDSPLMQQRVQLAGKVEVSQNGELVAPEWADDPTRLFISHLPPDYDASALQALFESHGTVVSAKISQDKRSARPKTYGFVQYALAEHAAKAVKELHGTLVDNRTINVAYEATQSVAKHKHEMQQMYYMQQASQMGPYTPGGPSSHMPGPPHHHASNGGSGGSGGGKRRGGGGGRGRGSRMPFYPPPYYQGYPELGPDGAPYVPYVVDPATGAPMAPYPVYYPGMMPYTPEGMIPIMVPPPAHLASAEPYYPSSGRDSPQTA